VAEMTSNSEKNAVA